MGNRIPKEAKTLDAVPNDNRACSSAEFRPNSSNSSIQTNVASNTEIRDNGAKIPSSALDSNWPEINLDNDSYGSYDPDDAEETEKNYIKYQSRSRAEDHKKMTRILAQLNDETDPSGQLSLLIELCEVLSFCTENSLSPKLLELSAQLLVKLAKQDDNPDIMLLSIRAITYLCDVHPHSSEFLVQNHAVDVLCQRLMAIEYLDVAEQCLQALEKISREQPLTCLHGGATMAVLNYMDFFSTSVQRVALSTVVNICDKLPSECPSSFMEAVPFLCNHLQHEDKQDLIRLLAELSSTSMFTFTTLHELSISNLLKDMLSTFYLSQGIYSFHAANGQYNQVCELLNFLHKLLPIFLGDQNGQQASEKESFLINHPDLLQNFGTDILPLMIQMVNSVASMSVCYGCLIVIHSIVYLNKSEMLIVQLKDARIASLLTGILTRKDHHLLILSLKIAEMLLQKLSDMFVNSFIKEGVFSGIEALLSSEKCLALKEAPPVHESSDFENTRCLCCTFSIDGSSSVTETICCRLQKDSVRDLAEKVRSNYFEPDIYNLGGGETNILQMLQTSSAALEELSNDTSIENEVKLHHILRQLVTMLKGSEFISTFEFIESGIVKALLNYLSSGQYLMKNQQRKGVRGQFSVKEKRIEVFGKLFLSYSDSSSGELLLSILIRKLLSALSSLEKFPVTYNQDQGSKHRNYFAAVPNGRRISYPCLRVRFVKADGELCLCDYSEDVLTVDPLSSLDAIIEFLWPKVCTKRTKHIRSYPTSEAGGLTESQPLKSSPMEDKNLPPPPSDEAVNLDDTQVIFPEANNSLESEQPSVCSNEHASPKLLLYLDGQQLDSSLTFYQGSFLKFVTGSPRLPYGGLASLNPKLTVVRKHSSNPPVQIYQVS